MKNPEIQLMFYGNNVAGLDISTEDEGISIARVEKVENPNYQFVYFHLSKGLEAGQKQFQLTNNKGVSFMVGYEIKNRINYSSSFDQSNFMYLIMLDRFANSIPENDQVGGLHDQSLNRDSMFHRHGGDLKGIQSHLDHLSELNVTALWINPVLENNEPLESYHGYAATDLYKIDTRFGTMDATLKSTLFKMHNGLKRKITFNL